MKVRHALLTLLTLALSACSNSDGPGTGLSRAAVGMIGGQVVAAKEPLAKSTALLLLYDAQTSSAYICSAVLISSDLLLSAAHCFFDETTGRLRGGNFTKFILFGSSFDMLSEDAFKTAYPIAETSYAVHPQFSKSTLANDIAVLRLAKPLLAGLTPVPILQSLKGIRDVTVAGFGLSDTKTTVVPRISKLRFLKTQLSGQKNSSAPLTVSVKISPKARPAIGDSGGPAFATLNGTLFLWGLDSHSLESPEHEYYTPIAPYLNFVRTSARKLGSRTL